MKKPLGNSSKSVPNNYYFSSYILFGLLFLACLGMTIVINLDAMSCALIYCADWAKVIRDILMSPIIICIIAILGLYTGIKDKSITVLLIGIVMSWIFGIYSESTAINKNAISIGDVTIHGIVSIGMIIAFVLWFYIGRSYKKSLIKTFSASMWLATIIVFTNFYMFLINFFRLY